MVFDMVRNVSLNPAPVGANLHEGGDRRSNALSRLASAVSRIFHRTRREQGGNAQAIVLNPVHPEPENRANNAPSGFYGMLAKPTKPLFYGVAIPRSIEHRRALYGPARATYDRVSDHGSVDNGTAARRALYGPIRPSAAVGGREEGSFEGSSEIEDDAESIYGYGQFYADDSFEVGQEGVLDGGEALIDPSGFSTPVFCPAFNDYDTPSYARDLSSYTFEPIDELSRPDSGVASTSPGSDDLE